MRGSVFKRGRTWTAQVYWAGAQVTGRKRYRQLGGFGTKRAAEQALTEQLERLRVGEYVDAGATTVAGFVERWLTAVEPSLRPTTFASYRNMLGLHVVPRLGKVRLVKLTGLDLSGRALRRAPRVRVPEGQHDPRALAHHGEVHPSDRAEGACRRRPLGSAGPEPGGAGRPSPQERPRDGDMVGAPGPSLHRGGCGRSTPSHVGPALQHRDA